MSPGRRRRFTGKLPVEGGTAPASGPNQRATQPCRQPGCTAEEGPSSGIPQAWRRSSLSSTAVTSSAKGRPGPCAVAIGGAGWEQLGALNGVELHRIAHNGAQRHLPPPAPSRFCRSELVPRPGSLRSTQRHWTDFNDSLSPLMGECAQVKAVATWCGGWALRWEQIGCSSAKWSP